MGSLRTSRRHHRVAFHALPAERWPRSTNPLERVNRDIGRRIDVVGIFPNAKALLRLAASVVIEQNDEWLVGRRCLSLDSLALLLEQYSDHEHPEGVPALTATEQPTVTPKNDTTSWD